MSHRHRNLQSLSLQDPTAHAFSSPDAPPPPRSGRRHCSVGEISLLILKIHAEPEGSNSCGAGWGQSCELLGDQALLAVISSQPGRDITP